MTTSTEPKEVVLAFLKTWETEGFVPAFERHLGPDALWQNTGFPDCKGREAYMKLLHYYQEFSQMPYARVEMKNLAVAGNVVLTERIDHLYNQDRSRQHSAPIMGTFVVENGLIQRYSDYFDAAQFQAMIGKAA